LPVIDEKDERLRKEERLSQVRHLIETLDLLFDAFVERRLSADWSNELEVMRGWLLTEERANWRKLDDCLLWLKSRRVVVRPGNKARLAG
jgi:hypothetical protein